MENKSSTIDYKELVNPAIGQRLQLLKLDKVYHRAQGSYLYCFDESNEVKVTDFVSGYGAVLLGYNNELLKHSAIDYLKDDHACFAQLSVKDASTETAKWLHDEIKDVTGDDFIVTFCNSGAEAVEAAIKHALIEFYEKLNGFKNKFEQESAYIVNLISRKDETHANELKKKLNNCHAENNEIINQYAPVVLATKNAFHGKTLRAAMTCWNGDYSTSFAPNNSATKFIELNADQIEQAFQEMVFHLMFPALDACGQLYFRSFSFNRIAAAIVEPIQGEGGIRPVPKAFLMRLRNGCSVHHVPLIFDEIQTGCYRTGPLLASSRIGIKADYYLLGKALGGGLAKISTMLINKKRYKELFGIIHSSTFAEDGFSSFVALKALQLSKANAGEIEEKGNKIMEHLHRLKNAYPSIVCDARGLGLMVGVEFKDFTESNSYCFQLMSRSGYLQYLYTAYLLNVWNVRVAATLSAKNILRIQPAVSINDEDIDRLMQGLYALSEILYCEDFYKLIEFLLPRSCSGLREKPGQFAQGSIPREQPGEGACKVGFVIHCIDADTVRKGEPSLSILSEEVIEDLMEKILPISTPTILGSKSIADKNGKKVHITFAGLSLTSDFCRKALTNKTTKSSIELCQKAVQLLKEQEHVELVGLGQYTSILTNNGQSIPETGIGLTTGNSFPVYLGMEAILSRLKEKSTDAKDVKVAIIGAAGNIASIMAELFSLIVGGVILIGNPYQNGYQNIVRTARNIYQTAIKTLLSNGYMQHEGVEDWLIQSGVLKKIQDGEWQTDDPLLYEKIEKNFGDAMFVQAAKSLDALHKCGVVIVATSASKPFLYPEHFGPNTIICDLSVPHNCSDELIHNNKSIEIIFGAVAQLPKQETIPVKGLQLEAGQVYGCMGETLLLGLENHHQSFSIGNISRQQVEWIGAIARKHGFSTAAEKKFVMSDK